MKMKTICPGIRLKSNGRYLATKCFRGKRFYAEFDTLRDAKHWRNIFYPGIPENLLSKNCKSFGAMIPSLPEKPIATIQRMNGNDEQITVSEMYDKYKIFGIKGLTSYSQYKKTQRMDKFLQNLRNLRLCHLNHEVIQNHLDELKLLTHEDSRRCNFDKELKDFASILRWYSQLYDPTFILPVTKTHFKAGKIKEIPVKEKKVLSDDELSRFIQNLKEPFQTLALTQYLLGNRIQSAAALSIRTVDLHTRIATISEKVVWIKGKPHHVWGTKTGKVVRVRLNEEIVERLSMLDKQRPKGCAFFFHRRGKLLRYGQILAHYNRALSAAGISHLTGTHLLRHTIATFSRKNFGLDASQAILGHTTARMSELYAQLDVNEKASMVVMKAGEAWKALRESSSHATKCDQRPEVTVQVSKT